MKNQQRLSALLLLLLLASLSACSSITGSSDSGLGGTRFYSLSSLPPTTATPNALRIGIGPVEIPRLLNRPQIVSRKNQSEIEMAEFHQWGGSYKEELIQSLTDNLSSLLKTENIEQYPWKFSFKPQYQVRINIERFDGQLGKNVTLKARWRLLKNNKEVLVKRAVINTPVSGNSYNAYVSAQSKALITLSRQIAAKIK
jgi:uncharacterized lipoprotein YmbA